MAIFRREETSELPESQVEFKDTSGARQWIALALYIVMALVVAILVVLAGRWVYHKLHNDSGPNPAPVAPQATRPTQLASPNTTQKSPTGTSGTNSSPTPAPTPPSSKRPTSTANPGALPNNGPGDVVALFVGVSLVAAGLHYAVALKRT
jgi:hypothetical protein